MVHYTVVIPVKTGMTAVVQQHGNPITNNNSIFKIPL